jgi:hypothetical protein
MLFHMAVTSTLTFLLASGNLPTNATYWSLMNSGIKYIGAYSGGTAYKINELVTYGAKLYVAKAVTTGNLAYRWNLLGSISRWY